VPIWPFIKSILRQSSYDCHASSVERSRVTLSDTLEKEPIGGGVWSALSIQEEAVEAIFLFKHTKHPQSWAGWE
jgi:hypothetical protein